MKVKTSELTGLALDWAVAKARGLRILSTICGEIIVADARDGEPLRFEPSKNWTQGGPIIERERIDLNYDPGEKLWTAHWFGDSEYSVHWGDTLLIAAMRCFVASRLGDEVEVPL